jgi:hypothetical protein
MIFSVLTQIQKISKPLPYMYMAAPTPVWAWARPCILLWRRIDEEIFSTRT